ncbi:ATP-binding protein [Leifsonia poae]|uniref:ATPase n=1 Tax=Leifsonia poae TaxID=110933 RepID=A0A9W6HBV8_9MICO|nr:ATP-binding protein [Leifsonia poae]GLJ77199.1 ATPase [Leifsonia poae]
MSARSDWLDANNAFLTSALAELRSRLTALAEEHHRNDRVVPAMPAAPMPEPHARRGFGGRRHSDDASAAPAVLRLEPAEPPPTAQPTISPAAADPDAHGTGDESGAPADSASTPAVVPDQPALLTLADRLGLTDFERDVVLLCAAVEFDTGLGGLMADALEPQHRYPTFALALAALPDPSWDALSPDGPLRYWGLIHVDPGGPIISSRLTVDERILHYLKGLTYLDDDLAGLLSPLPAASADLLPPSQSAIVESILEALRLRQGTAVPVIQLLGAGEEGKRAVAQAVSARFGAPLLALAADGFPVDDARAETLTRLIRRETALNPFALFIDVRDVERTAPQVPPLGRWLGRTDQLVFLDAADPWPAIDGAVADVGKPTPAEQHAAWSEQLPPAVANAADRLTGQFDFELPTIHRIAAQATARAAASGDGGAPASDAAEQLWQDCLLQARPVMDQLAQRITPLGQWNDIQLPADELELLHEIAAQVEQRSTVYDGYGFRDKLNRGLGISVLFAGQSGTGKTLAAEVLANGLGLLLYRIDLSAVVSKYIGETEKNLRRLFDAADGGGAILFFDEADALFGKRSEVKDSHDRYANIEVNYLLQRMETYRGLAILATNLKSALDTAFVRRLRFIVDFPFPGVSERRKIWENVFPQGLSVDRLDFDRLAGLDLTGGSISNVALNSAFRAAHAGGDVDMPTVLASARVEFRKLDRPIAESEFAWTAPEGSSA